MPRLSTQLPKYSHHKLSGRAYVTLDGRKVYLGPYESKTSRAQYDLLVGEWLANGRRLPPHWISEEDQDDLRIVELIERYLMYAQDYYRKADGTNTTEINTLCNALKPLNNLYEDTPVKDFGPLALKSVRQSMLEQGWCRNHINKQISRIKQMFKWAVENELIPVEVYQALCAVTGLKKGRSQARV